MHKPKYGARGLDLLHPCHHPPRRVGGAAACSESRPAGLSSTTPWSHHHDGNVVTADQCWRVVSAVFAVESETRGHDTDRRTRLTRAAGPGPWAVSTINVLDVLSLDGNVGGVFGPCDDECVPSLRKPQRTNHSCSRVALVAKLVVMIPHLGLVLPRGKALA